MAFSSRCAAFILLSLIGVVALTLADEKEPFVRGPPLHEHSFQAPLVDDWWSEGVPHFMIGGSAVANENFLRLTTHSLDDHGFAFNTAPLDHDNWEVRVKLSVRPPGPAVRNHDSSVKYQGGDGLAFWYLEQPIGDDHQHVAKYSKVVTAELLEENLEKDNPWRLADEILQDDAEEDFDDAVDEEDLTEEEKQLAKAAKIKRELKRKQREDLFRRLFRRGTSFDAGDEPRVMGVKHSDFSSGFAVVLDSVGEEGTHQPGESAHHGHKSSIFLLLNVPNHTANSGQKVVNNFNGGRANFRQSPRLLQCDYDFRQEGAREYNPDDAFLSPAARARKAPEEPIELVVRYYEKKLSVIIRREIPEKRKIIEEGKEGVDVERTYRETLCGELYPVVLPQKYHFGLSAATGHRPHKQKREKPMESLFYSQRNKALMHVDVHDVYQFELRELGKDIKSMGYSKSVPIEHFDFDKDHREREHFSRQIPVEPDADV